MLTNLVWRKKNRVDKASIVAILLIATEGLPASCHSFPFLESMHSGSIERFTVREKSH